MHAVSARPVLALAAVAAASLAAAAAYEEARSFKASEVLKAAQVKGPHYQVAAEVPTGGFFHEFKLVTDFGTLEVEGRGPLLGRIHEVGAIAQLDEVSKSEVFLKAAGTSLINTGKGVAAAVKDPEATAKGMGQGIKRFGTNLGRKGKRTADKAVDSATSKDDTKKTEGTEKSTTDKAAEGAESVANSVLGVNGAARKWAQKVGVDPYTTNSVLRKALVDLGRIDAAGGLAAKIAVPVPPVVSGTAKVGTLVWSADPEAVLKANEKSMAEMGVGPDVVKQLYLAKGFTLTLHTRLVSALRQVNAKGCADYVATAAESDNHREAVFFVQSAEMLALLHEKSPVAAVLPDSRAMIAKTKDGTAVVLLPVDYVRWTAFVEKALGEIAGRAKAELGATKLELRTTATVSPAAKEEIAARGFTVTERVPYAQELMQARAAAAPQK
ncbi:MAG TPA: hypothetical protein VGB87_09860 [Vicinamibacteria bacterium]